jgi:hypothetical protein
MMRMNRFLALIPVVVLIAACGGVAPTASSAITSNDPYAIGGDVSAMASGKESCRLITDVMLRILPDDGTGNVVLQAQYRYEKPGAGECPIGPAWTASRRGLYVNPCTPFLASIGRNTEVRTNVTATAPNGRSANLVF